MSMQDNPYQTQQDPLLDGQMNEQIYQNLDKLPVAQDIRQSYNPDAYAADSNPLVEKKPSKHIRSLTATFFLVAGEATFLSLYFTGVLDVDTGGLIGICVGVYVFYLMLALCCNPLFSYFNNVEHGSNFETQYNKIRSIVGHFVFHAECYHYETRFHTRTVTDGNGNTRTETYTTQQKVVTHVATQDIRPRQCLDDSGAVDQVRAMTEIIFVHNKVNYRFKDDFSRRRFQELWYSFQARHRRDVHQNYSQNFNLPGLKARMTFYIGAEPKNYSCLLVLWTLIGMIWPFSIYVQAKISRFDIEYMKVVAL